MSGRIILGVLVVLLVLRVLWRVFKKKRPQVAADTSTPAQLKKPLAPWQKGMYTVYVFAKLNTRRFFRDKTAIFFTVAFPLIFLFVFGGIFGKSGNSVSFKVAILNESHSQFSQQFTHNVENSKVFNVSKDVTNLSGANDKMAHGQLDATIVLPPNFGDQHAGQKYPTGQAQVIYTQNNAQAASTLVSVLDGEFKTINAKFVNTPTPFTVTSKQTNTHSLTTFDYTFSGLLG